MKRGVDGEGRPGRRVGSSSLILMALLIGVGALAGCQSGKDDASSPGVTSGTSSQRSGPAAAPAVAAQVAILPANGAVKVRLDKAVTVKVAQGRLSAVSVTTAQGNVLTGSLAPDQLSWASSAPLLADTRYQVSVVSAAADGSKTTSSSSFSTLTPSHTASVYIQPSNGWKVGVGMPIVVNFSKPVTEPSRPAVEKALKVTTAANLEGSWRWFTSEQVQWRPKVFWPANTKVSVSADLSGVSLGPGLWGDGKVHTSQFTVGSAMVSTVDVAKHTLTVTRNGQVLRVIPVTTGRAGLATRNGIKVIMSRETTHRMDSTSIGIKRGQAGYYNILTKYAMRLTYSGEFLHAAPWSTGSQGRANVSHGCTGMSTAAAQWLFGQSKVGDVFIFKNSTRPLEWGNGYTAWNKSYAAWQNA